MKLKSFIYYINGNPEDNIYAESVEANNGGIRFLNCKDAIGNQFDSLIFSFDTFK